MEQLNSNPAPLTLTSAHAFAAALPLPAFDTSQGGLPKLQRLARICQVNPDVVNQQLPPHHHAPYYQALYDHLDAFALDLEEL